MEETRRRSSTPTSRSRDICSRSREWIDRSCRSRRAARPSRSFSLGLRTGMPAGMSGRPTFPATRRSRNCRRASSSSGKRRSDSLDCRGSPPRIRRTLFDSEPNPMKKPLKVAVTGAGGQIGYALIFRIAAGDVFGPDQPVSLRLLEITPALPALNGTLMELDDCAFPLLVDVRATDQPTEAFEGADWVIMVGGFPRKEGM